MIDFRYHLVSIVAVFLALAIGIVLGSTSEARNGALALLQQSSNSLKNELNATQAKSDAYQAQASAQEQFLQTAEPRLLARLLDGDSIVIITEPGAQGSVVDGVKKAAALAGATVTGEVALQPKFNDISAANTSSLSSINNSIASTTGTVLDNGSDSRTNYQQQAAQLIATAILSKTVIQPGLTTADPQTLLSYYAQAGYLTVSPARVSRPAQLAVLVTPQAAPAGGPDDPANQVLLAVAQEFAGASAATVVAGGTSGSAQPSSAISALRSSSVSGQVSTVDDADTTLGDITVVQALAALVAGGKPNSYGISGASAVTPVPMPSASASATVTTTPSTTPTATGKAGQKK